MFEFTGTVIAGVLVGYVLDNKFDTAPIILIVTTLTAVVGGFVRLVRVLRRLERQRSHGQRADTC